MKASLTHYIHYIVIMGATQTAVYIAPALNIQMTLQVIFVKEVKTTCVLVFGVFIRHALIKIQEQVHLSND